jgi:hypothetical protein
MKHLLHTYLQQHQQKRRDARADYRIVRCLSVRKGILSGTDDTSLHSPKEQEAECNENKTAHNND